MSNPFAPKNGFSQAYGNPMQRPNNGNMVEELKQFAQNFRGNPKQEVDRLRSTGQMTEQQFNFLVGEIQRRFPFLNTGGMIR